MSRIDLFRDSVHRSLFGRVHEPMRAPEIGRVEKLSEYFPKLSRWIAFRNYLTLLAAVLLLPIHASARLPESPVSKGLNVVDWSAIRREYDRHRRGMFPYSGG